MEYGTQCVVMGGMSMMLKLCVNNWDMMDVSTILYFSIPPAISFTTLFQHHIYYCTVHPHTSIWKMLTAEEMRAS